jgi:hypothetical protein
MTKTEQSFPLPPRPRKKPNLPKARTTEWCRVVAHNYEKCTLCGGRLKRGTSVLRTNTGNDTYIYQEKHCLESMIKQSPFDKYDQIKQELEAGEGFNWESS